MAASKSESKPEPTEQSSLCEDLNHAYGLSSHATWAKAPITNDDCITDYEPMKLSSMRILCVAHGTILSNPILFVEQLLITSIFFGCALPVYVYFKSEASGQDMKLSRFLEKQETKMRAFAGIMTGLAAFLLSFYTAIAVARWWTMRSEGIGKIKASVVDLQMLIFQLVTQEQKVLNAVERYGRASLLLIFMWRQKDLDDLKEIMLDREILTEEECDALLECKHCLHETIWGWQAAIITNLNKKGMIKSPRLLTDLLQKVAEGRAAAQCIHTHLAVRVPMQYVHLLGFLVKMHNIVLAVIMGLLFGAALRNEFYILCVQLFARTLILPFLFNAILLINVDLADPFNGGPADFPGEIYQRALQKDSAGILDTSKNLPDVLKDAV